MHRGVRVDGTTVHGLRTEKGLNQLQLANMAGVSERTVRNAEKSQVLETYIANYIAIALDVSLNDIVLERAIVTRGTQLRKLIRKVSSAYLKAVLEGSTHSLLDLLHPKIEWNCWAAPQQAFAGHFMTVSQVRRHLEATAAWWEQFSAQASDFSLQRTDAEGDMIYFHLSVKVKNETAEKVEIWQSFICRFDEDLLSVVDQSLGILQSSRSGGNSRFPPL